MKKTLFTALAALLAILSAQAQSCLPGGIEFYSQDDVDNFQFNYPGCSNILGDVYIGFSDVSNLNGLSQITSIGGSLVMEENDALTNLGGLGNLSSVGGILYIQGNDMLADLTGLNNLDSVGGYLLVYGNNNLASLSGLDGLHSLGGIDIQGNAVLPNLNGLDGITAIPGNLFVLGTPALTGFSGLGNLQTIGGRFELNYNTGLTNFNGLSALQYIGDSLVVYENAALLNFEGLTALRAIGKRVLIHNNPVLVNFEGLDSLRSIGDSLVIFSNPALTSLDGLSVLDSIADDFSVRSNYALTSLNGLDSLRYIGEDFDLADNPGLTQLTGLERLETIGGHFLLGGNVFVANSVTSLDGLDSLRYIGGDFSVPDDFPSFSGVEKLAYIGGNLDIDFNTVLTSFEGLNQLATIGGDFRLNYLSQLPDISGLENLTTIGGDFYINQLEMLTSLSGLGNLTTVGGDFYIDNQTPGITNLNGLDNLKSIGGDFFLPYLLSSFQGVGNLETIGGGFHASYFANLEDFDGLGSLSSIGGYFFVLNNPELLSFQGLENLTSVGNGIRIEENPKLTSLSGLINLTFIGGPETWIIYNPQLSNCAIYAICNALFVNNPDVITAVGLNGPGCATLLEAIASCNTIPVHTTVRIDQNGDCLPDDAEPTVEGIQVRLSGNGQMVLRPSDQHGAAHFNYFNSGPFTLYLLQYPSNNWAVCQDDILVTPDTAFVQDTLKVTFLLSPLQQECAELEVELGLPSNFRGCLVSSDMEVSVKNTGNLLAEAVKLAVVKPKEIDLLTSTPPLSAQQGDTLYFELGDLAPLSDTVVKMKVKTNCDFFLFERTLCFEAFAQTLIPCPSTLPPASEIKLTAQCLGDTTVRFTIKNTGDAPTQGLHEYVLFRNEAVSQTGSFSLNSQQSMEVDVPADAATYRMEATKFDDGTLTFAVLENCGGVTPAQITAFWLDEGPVAYDFDCREVNAPFDPNQKTAVPTGAGPEHIIQPNRSLQYTIDFQNTGTDTAFRVLLQDVLPVNLDANTFHPGFASHPYTWEIRGMDSLDVLFFPIALPDSNMNEPASHGFFSFEIFQKAGLPIGTTVENTAGIIFDFNPSIVTNTVLHTIGELTVEVDELQTHPNLWQVWGNPTRDMARFRATKFTPGEKRFELTDATGRVVRLAQFSGQSFDFQRGELPAGLYFFRIGDTQGRMFTGKIVVAD